MPTLQHTTNSKTNETVLTNNKMSKKYFYGIRNQREQKEASDGKVFTSTTAQKPKKLIFFSKVEIEF